MKQQSHIDRLYLSVKDMVEHRKTKLEQQYWLYQLHKDVEELDKWITEHEVVASSTELGQDLQDVTVSLSPLDRVSKMTNLHVKRNLIHIKPPSQSGIVLPGVQKVSLILP